MAKTYRIQTWLFPRSNSLEPYEEIFNNTTLDVVVKNIWEKRAFLKLGWEVKIVRLDGGVFMSFLEGSYYSDDGFDWISLDKPIERHQGGDVKSCSERPRLNHSLPNVMLDELSFEQFKIFCSGLSTAYDEYSTDPYIEIQWLDVINWKPITT